MKVFCPRCATSISTESGAAGATSHVTCPGCGFVVDVALADTAAGRPVVPVVRDFSGETLGSLRLGSCLGAGGMGTVYDAEDTGSGERVAVKIMFPQLSAQPDLVERFAREAQALREISHPNIVGFRNQGEQDGYHYLVMEYAQGQSLEERLKDGPLSIEEVRTITRQLCDALSAAHARGIVHRDLKPANIMLYDGQVKVLDFGIAQMGTDDLTLTRSDAMLGTLNYMAPEQRTGAKEVDHRADIFSTGVILYRMLTTQFPIGRFDSPSEIRPEVPKAVDEVVTRALATQPERRFQSAQELADALTNAKASRFPVTWVAGAAAAVLAAALIVGLTWPEDAEDPANSPDAKAVQTAATPDQTEQDLANQAQQAYGIPNASPVPSNADPTGNTLTANDTSNVGFEKTLKVQKQQLDEAPVAKEPPPKKKVIAKPKAKPNPKAALLKKKREAKKRNAPKNGYGKDPFAQQAQLKEPPPDKAPQNKKTGKKVLKKRAVDVQQEVLPTKLDLIRKK